MDLDGGVAPIPWRTGGSPPSVCTPTSYDPHPMDLDGGVASGQNFQDGPRRVQEVLREPKTTPRWLKIAHDAAIWPPKMLLLEAAPRPLQYGPKLLERSPRRRPRKRPTSFQNLIMDFNVVVVVLAVSLPMPPREEGPEQRPQEARRHPRRHPPTEIPPGPPRDPKTPREASKKHPRDIIPRGPGRHPRDLWPFCSPSFLLLVPAPTPSHPPSPIPHPCSSYSFSSLLSLPPLPHHPPSTIQPSPPPCPSFARFGWRGYAKRLDFPISVE